MTIIDKVLNRLHYHRLIVQSHYFTRPGMEPVYQNLFTREIAALNVKDRYYPVAAAANYGLLYLIARCLSGLPIRSVLEIGAGQTTLLIDDIRKALSLPFEIVTLEHDSLWCDIVRESISHEVRHTPLSPTRTANRAITYYGNSDLAEKRFDMVIVDGPPAYRYKSRYDRLGFLDYLSLLSDDFVLIIDDSERPGERQLGKEVAAFLHRRGTRFTTGELVAGKVQRIFATGRYAKAAYF